jgi:hypothetical protein
MRDEFNFVFIYLIGSFKETHVKFGEYEIRKDVEESDCGII